MLFVRNQPFISLPLVNIIKLRYDMTILIAGGAGMEAIRPSSDLRNHYNEISRQCHEERNPVIITVNGRGIQ